uniref:Immunoglobulin I-set domain-containing protein n=1 Tax=Plectus sambesii TaxID=2011161 RepID=A0A914VRR1_9BILA
FEDDQVTWFVEGKEITESDEKHQITVDGDTRQLIIRDVVPGGPSDYSVKLGDFETHTKLVIDDTPVEFT